MPTTGMQEGLFPHHSKGEADANFGVLLPGLPKTGWLSSGSDFPGLQNSKNPAFQIRNPPLLPVQWRVEIPGQDAPAIHVSEPPGDRRRRHAGRPTAPPVGIAF